MILRPMAAVVLAASLIAASPPTAAVDRAHVEAHEKFLAGEPLRGRASATNDEAIAAAYVASQFQQFGLKPPPGWTSYIQTAPLVPTPFTRQLGMPEDSKATNAVGFLPGTDPKAGILLITAHLDHLGQRGKAIYYGANDNASGTTAVLELTRVLAATAPHRRSIMFACYGAEELGLIGSNYFVAHPPVPIHDIVANIEFEMVGSPDPQFAKGTLMMTGFERSNLGPTLRARGALIMPDPYPKQNFFERSDNYSLALQGVVAHTISGWATIPSYHMPTDTIANIDMEFMTHAIQSLVEPVTWLADSNFRPQWTKDGAPRPHRKE